MQQFTDVHEYGGVQGSVVRGLGKNGGEAVIGIQNVKTGQVLSKEEIINSAIGDGLEQVDVASSVQFIMVTRQVNFRAGVAANPGNPGTAQRGPDAVVVDRKIFSGAQKEVVKEALASSSARGPEAVIVSKKVFEGLQEEVTPGQSKK
jgi:hypothetical protein